VLGIPQNGRIGVNKENRRNIPTSSPYNITLTNIAFEILKVCFDTQKKNMSLQHHFNKYSSYLVQKIYLLTHHHPSLNSSCNY
jgi:hypothetical protein